MAPPPQFVDTEDKLAHSLQYWRNYSFSKGCIKLQDAVDSLGREDRLVNAYKQFAPRWVLVKRGTKKQAVFHWAGVWRWNSHLETGNFVPIGKTPPERLPEDRIQPAASSLCQLSYGIDTERDKSLWEAQKTIEAFIVTAEGWNPHKKPRRPWQSGQTGKNSSFILTSHIFCKRTPYTTAKEARVRYPLHEWVAEATGPDSEYFPNPDRPTMGELRGNTVVDIKTCTPPALKLGDIVWFSFVIDFYIGREHWVTNMVPLQFVRVGRLSPDMLPSLSMEEEEPDPADRIEFGQQVQIEGDFPMYTADSAPAEDKTDDSQKSGNAAQQVANNEFRFGPDDADLYRSARSCEIERSLETMNTALKEQRSSVNTTTTTEVRTPEVRLVEEADDVSDTQSERETGDAPHIAGNQTVSSIAATNTDTVHSAPSRPSQSAPLVQEPTAEQTGNDMKDVSPHCNSESVSAWATDTKMEDLTPISSPEAKPLKRSATSKNEKENDDVPPAVDTEQSFIAAAFTAGDDLTPPPSPDAKPAAQHATKKAASAPRSPAKSLSRKRRASTERPIHAAEGGTRPLRERRNVVKARQ